MGVAGVAATARGLPPAATLPSPAAAPPAALPLLAVAVDPDRDRSPVTVFTVDAAADASMLAPARTAPTVDVTALDTNTGIGFSYRMREAAPRETTVWPCAVAGTRGGGGGGGDGKRWT